MSAEAVVAVLHHSRTSGTTKVVLMGIANHDGDGGAWPSIATLVKYAQKSESAVHRAIQTAVELGELRVLPNAGGFPETRADRRPNRYEILVRCPPECDGSLQHQVAKTTPRAEDGVASTRERGRVSASNGVASTRPELDLEPSLELSDDSVVAENANEKPAKRSPRGDSARRPRARDPIWDALVEVFGDPGPRRAQAFYGSVARDLREIGATGDEVLDRGRRARARFGAGATPAALEKNWRALAPPGPTAGKYAASGIEGNGVR